MSGDVEKDIEWPFDRETTIGFATLAVVAMLGALGYLYVTGNILQGPQEVVLEERFAPVPPTSEALAKVQQSRGFAVLVSYTDNGFEPREVHIQPGETVRFTNNSSHELWVAAVGSANSSPYPGSSDCGASAFDTCGAIEPRDFWEFTFEARGAWAFRNTADQNQTGIVYVETANE